MDSTNTLPQIESDQASKEVVANELFAAASPAMVYGRNAETSGGLVWGYLGGRWSGNLIANGTSTLTASTTTYMVVSRTTGAVSFSTSATNWNDAAGYARAYKIVTGTATVTSYEDHRGGDGGSNGASSSPDAGEIYPSDQGNFYDGSPAPSLTEMLQQIGERFRDLSSDDIEVIGSGLGSPSTLTAVLQFIIDEIDAASGLTNFTEAGHTSSPNNTVNASSLTVVAGSTNADAVFSPKGTGAVLAHIPDGTATGGNKRGASVVDLQTVRSAASHVASGTQAVLVGGTGNRASGNTTFVGGGTSNVASATGDVVCGGHSNTASGGNSTIGGGGGSGVGNTASGLSATVSGGSANTASGNYSTVGGGQSNVASATQATVRGGSGNTADGSNSDAAGLQSNAMGLFGANVFSSGRFAAAAYSQRVEMVLRCETTNATQTTLTADQGAASATNQLALVNSSAYIVRGEVVARQNTTGDTASWEFVAVIRRGANAAATAMVAAATVTAIASDAGAATWALAVDADTTNGCLRIRFTGEASKTIRTTCVLRAAQTVG